MHRIPVRKSILWLTAAASLAMLGAASQASAGVVECNANASCGWTVSIGGQVAGSGGLTVGDDGAVALSGNTSVAGAGGSTVNIQSFNGNTDPFLAFAFAATNNSGNLQAFSISFSIPIAVTEPFAANSTLQYGFSANPALGASYILPTDQSGFIMVANDHDIVVTPGNPPVVTQTITNKGVNLGHTCAGNGPTTNCAFNEGFADGIAKAGPSFIDANGDHTYDLMVVTLGFIASNGVAASMNGSVTQTVPEPSTYALLAGGLLLVGFMARRKMS